MKHASSIKPQDILLLLKLLVTKGLNQQDLASSLEISQGEISLGLRRLKLSGLLGTDSTPNREACVEFLIHGSSMFSRPS